MPRKFLKRYSPSPKTIRENKALSYLGEDLHRPSLWHMNRSSVSKAFAIGLFCTWIPFPLQTVIAAILAIYYRAHLPISVALVFVTNPITIPPMFYFAYKLGSVMLGVELESVPMDLSWEWFTSTLHQIWQPLLFGCLILAIVSSAVGYFTINTIWRKNIKHRWKCRVETREAAQAKKEMMTEIKKAMKDT
ncbi:DUF2062 domain-containing protein [uncultured Cocleimonas sp.]|uniref:DUF2062 domain-containing protein n=1 Tax=uncultured Cocleimonas sp. TaxID=1051587 RepID=UPI002620577C|nr:DUF2062 domain-containing protein [uncultured Cocleimonas sp.]